MQTRLTLLHRNSRYCQRLDACVVNKMAVTLTLSVTTLKEISRAFASQDTQDMESPV